MKNALKLFAIWTVAHYALAYVFNVLGAMKEIRIYKQSLAK